MSFKRPCPDPDHESPLGHQRGKKTEHGLFPQRAYRERLKAKLEGLEDEVPAPQELFIDAAPTPRSEITNPPLDSKAASTTYPDVATPAAHHDLMTSAAFDLASIDAAYPSEGCLGSHHLDFPTASDFHASLSPHGTSLSLDPQNVLRRLQDDCSVINMPSYFERSKPGPLEYVRPEIPSHSATNPHPRGGRSIDRAAPVQDRIRHIVDSAIEAGFTNFDEAIEAYYTETFDETSPLDRDQRLSRNRRLPRLLGALRDASKDWSHWERRGFQEQITQGAEDILVDELELFRKEYPDTAFLREMTSSELGGGQTAGTSRGSRNRRTFQDNLPNLWALATTLVARTNASRHDSDCEAVLRIIEALCASRSNGS
ncbi:BZIP transcription factor [Fusarium keratoplasticum]|uniref:BZIP transcription factor n=1 Tax=Fusarium keratoplasticum TaxID=1328300 RepID=A0ACC0QS54_9HYPO|nr:BZIP transcription factor [Fusarium keratoplasticum]KAI8665893.1 BZIP transcription factor [Fusarium keratoplasticum]